MKIKSSIRGAVFEPRSLAAVLRSPIAIASSKGRGVKAVITEGDKRLDNSLAEKLDTKRRERATTFDIRRGRIRPCTGRATLLSLSLSPSPSASDFNGTLHLQRTGGESRAGRQFSLAHNINVSSRSSGFIVYSIAPLFGSKLYSPFVIAYVKPVFPARA